MKWPRVLFLILAIVYVLWGNRAYPCSLEQKRGSLPDLTQTDPEAEFNLLGYVMCGPVAVSNVLVWLSSQGYRDLVDLSADPFSDQVRLARKLASEEYMNTRFSKGGTRTADLLTGLEKYIVEKGFRNSRISYSGWNIHPERFSLGNPVPSLEELMDGLPPSAGMIINLGWYRYDLKKDTYHREGGHWVTLAGHGEGYMLVHDPAPWSGRHPSSHRVGLEKILHGLLDGGSGGLPRNAYGYYRIREGLPLPKKGIVGIIDGVVVIEMEVQFPGYSRQKGHILN